MDQIKNQLQISVSNDGFTDEGDGIVSFPNGLTITDDSIMRSGTRYDIDSLDIDNYSGTLTGDHVDSLSSLIGKTIGTAKEGNRVVVNAIKYAINENPYARLAYNLLVGGFSNSFSIETIGPFANDKDGVYRNHELVGLSQVVVPNNYNAKTNQFNEIVHNSLERSQQDGLDTDGIEKAIYSKMDLVTSEPVEEESMAKNKEVNASEIDDTPVLDEVENKTEVTETEVVETKVEAKAETKVEDKPEVEEKVEAEAKTETKAAVATEELEVEEEVEEPAEPETEELEVEDELDAEAEAVVAELEAEEKVEQETNKKEEKLEMTAEQIAEIVANAIKPVTDELAATKELAQNALDTQAKEPEFEKVEEIANSYDTMDAEELFAKQLNAAVAVERLQSVEGAKTLHEINARNLDALKEAKIVNASMTLDDLGNFVIGPELYK